MSDFFPARYALGEIGSGSHVHISLSQNGKNVFMASDECSRYGMSKVGEEFMSGVLNHLPSILAFTAPVPNRLHSLLSKHLQLDEILQVNVIVIGNLCVSVLQTSPKTINDDWYSGTSIYFKPFYESIWQILCQQNKHKMSFFSPTFALKSIDLCKEYLWVSILVAPFVKLNFNIGVVMIVCNHICGVEHTCVGEKKTKRLHWEPHAHQEFQMDLWATSRSKQLTGVQIHIWPCLP